MMEEILNKIMENLGKNIDSQGKISFLQTALNLTICSVNTKTTPKKLVEIYKEILTELLKLKIKWS
jgi:hypothetical protein